MAVCRGFYGVRCLVSDCFFGVGCESVRPELPWSGNDVINDVHLAGSKKGKRSGQDNEEEEGEGSSTASGRKKKKPLVKLNGNVA